MFVLVVLMVVLIIFKRPKVLLAQKPSELLDDIKELKNDESKYDVITSPPGRNVKFEGDAKDWEILKCIAEAHKKGADAVVNVRFTTSDVMQGASEVMAYGTAVRLK